MENIKNSIKKNLRLILAIACGVLIVVGILVFLFLAGDSDGWLKGVFIAFGTVLILIGCVLLVLAAVLSDAENVNFFLYDFKTKASISVDELDFNIINKKMTFVMTKLATSAAAAWRENVFAEDKEIFADGNVTYVPLIAYKMLYDLCERANEEVWQSYIDADATVVEAVAAAVELNGDHDLGKAFRFLHDNADGDYERTEKFLADNKKYIQNKMVKYVKANIDRF